MLKHAPALPAFMWLAKMLAGRMGQTGLAAMALQILPFMAVLLAM